MSSTPEPNGRRYEPTHPDELLARAKRRSLALRRHRLLGAGGSLAVVLALALGSVLILGSGAPGTRLPGKTYSADHRPGQIYVAERIGSAYELTANEAPATTAPPIVVRRVGGAEVSFSLDLLKQLAGPGAIGQRARLAVQPLDGPRDARARRIRFHRAGNRRGAS